RALDEARIDAAADCSPLGLVIRSVVGMGTQRRDRDRIDRETGAGDEPTHLRGRRLGWWILTGVHAPAVDADTAGAIHHGRSSLARLRVEASASRRGHGGVACHGWPR